ncbi:MAG: aminoacyl-tRNA deacylase [Bacilli bacterium]
MDDLRILLQDSGFPFEIIQHENPIHSAQEGADYFGIDIGQTARTLVLRSDQGYHAMIVSGDRSRVNFEEVSDMLACRLLKLANPKEVQQTIGCTVGSVPLVGLSLPCIVDKQLNRYSWIYGGTGAPTSTLKIIPAALEKLNDVIAFLD